MYTEIVIEKHLISILKPKHYKYCKQVSYLSNVILELFTHHIVSQQLTNKLEINKVFREDLIIFFQVEGKTIVFFYIYYILMKFTMKIAT